MRGRQSTPTHGQPQPLWLVLLLLLAMLAGCTRPLPEGALVITEIPAPSPLPSPVGRERVPEAPPPLPSPVERERAPEGRVTDLDQRYPAGSRVVVVWPPFLKSQGRVLSHGLLAAGDAVVCSDGQRVIFAGKADAGGSWQIYEAKITGGRPKQITSIQGGAMTPAVLANGDVVFSSPVPQIGQRWQAQRRPALYAQTPGQAPRRLTFGASGAVDPTVLADGRILYIAPRPVRPDDSAEPALGLFTVNNDGTEYTSYALDHDGAPVVHRPRQLLDGRIAFLAQDEHAQRSRVETVRSARPFASRTALELLKTSVVSSLEPAGAGALLACIGSIDNSAAVYRLVAGAKTLGEPLFADVGWTPVEANATRTGVAPMGHISTLLPGKSTGTILCLDANFTRQPRQNGQPTGKAQRVRILTCSVPGPERCLGEVLVQPDGSFLTEVPADIAIGLETLDAAGQVLQRLPPSFWVRPGENRSCIGCHEPSNRSPRNVRPLAVTMPITSLAHSQDKLATHPLK